MELCSRAMWVAPEVKMSVFLVAYCGVVMSFMGWSAQAFVGATDVMVNVGARVSKRATIKKGIERRIVVVVDDDDDVGLGPAIGKNKREAKSSLS